MFNYCLGKLKLEIDQIYCLWVDYNNTNVDEIEYSTLTIVEAFCFIGPIPESLLLLLWNEMWTLKLYLFDFDSNTNRKTIQPIMIYVLFLFTKKYAAWLVGIYRVIKCIIIFVNSIYTHIQLLTDIPMGIIQHSNFSNSSKYI